MIIISEALKNFNYSDRLIYKIKEICVGDFYFTKIVMFIKFK